MARTGRAEQDHRRPGDQLEQARRRHEAPAEGERLQAIVGHEQGGDAESEEQAAQLAAQPLEDGIVAHPVGDERRQPGGPLWAIVVGPRHANLPGDRVAVVADARVLDAAARRLLAAELDADTASATTRAHDDTLNDQADQRPPLSERQPIPIRRRPNGDNPPLAA